MILKLWWLLPLATMAFIASYQDIKYRKIPNGVALSVALLGVFFVLSKGEYSHALSSMVVLVIGAVLFQLRTLAAGDSKLLAAFALMIAPQFLPLTIWLIVTLGGVLALTQWLISQIGIHPAGMERGVPYGVPICLGSLFGIAASL
ncbi:A24 family peptidase [Vibrio sp. ED002]|uniref:A24 family peptidase n=1 Tax=Vibrio sp. ED002 TaxID=2785123 RepID=UPI00200F9826|nr:A24 family peptidase [Vibrio sp. ED002]UQA49726.1 A24 family peptidase [Vibrio sp. ED002]